MAIVIIRERRWRIVGGAVVVLGALCAASVLQAPSILTDWYDGLRNRPSGAQAALDWRTPNLPSVVRALLSRGGASSPGWPLTVIPAVAAVAAAWALWRAAARQQHDQHDQHDQRGIIALLPPVLCLSVFVAPFGWTFDHVVLTVPQVIIFLRAFSEPLPASRRWLLVALTLLCHAGLVAQSMLTRNDYLGFWWFPPAMLGVWLLAGTVERTAFARPLSGTP